MKTKHIFMSLALTAAFAACTNEEFVVSENTGGAEGELIELPEGFLLSGTRGDDADTKGAWEYGDATEGLLKHAWMPTEVVYSTSNYKYIPDMIGLSWTGVNGEVGISAATDMVHSNYKFTHYAWAINGQTAEYDDCGKTYDHITTIASMARVAKRDLTDGSVYYENNSGASTQISDWPAYTEDENETDITTGFFNTDNSTVYAGQYIVYAPFDPENVSNYVTATSETSFKKVSTNITKNNAFKDLNNEIFMYGTTTLEKGGIQAGSFRASNLSGFILLKLSGAMANLKKVILYDEDGQFLTKVGLSAKGIINGQKGTALYLDNAAVEKKYSKFITVEFNNAVSLAAAANNEAYIAIPVLPTEKPIQDLTVICVDEKNKAVDKTISGSMTIAAGGYASLNGGAAQWFEVEDVDKGEYEVATDAASLETLINAANSATSATSIKILGDITLTKSLSINNEHVTLGAVKDGKIIVPSASTQITLTMQEATLDVDVDVEENCCSTHPGKLAFIGANITKNSTINVMADEDDEDVVNDGQIAFGTNSSIKNNTTVVEGVVNNAGNMLVGSEGDSKKATVILRKGAKVVNSGTLTVKRSNNSSEGQNECDGNLSLDNGATLTNSGTLNVEGELSNYGTATNTGIIYDRVAAQVTGETNIPGGGEYVCDVNNNGVRFDVALNNRPAVTEIRFVENSVYYYLSKLNTGAYAAKVKKYVVNVPSGGTVRFLTGIDKTNQLGIVDAVKYPGVTNVVMSALEVKSGKLIVDERGTKTIANPNGYLPLHLTVTGEMKVANGASMTWENGRDRMEEVFKAGSLSIEKDGAVTVPSLIKATVDGDVNIENNERGKKETNLMIKNTSIMDVHGDFTNNGIVNITTATSSAGNVAGLIWVNSLNNVKGAAPSDKAHYPAGTPTVRPVTSAE